MIKKYKQSKQKGYGANDIFICVTDSTIHWRVGEDGIFRNIHRCGTREEDVRCLRMDIGPRVTDKTMKKIINDYWETSDVTG